MHKIVQFSFVDPDDMVILDFHNLSWRCKTEPRTFFKQSMNSTIFPKRMIKVFRVQNFRQLWIPYLCSRFMIFVYQLYFYCLGHEGDLATISGNL